MKNKLSIIIIVAWIISCKSINIEDNRPASDIIGIWQLERIQYTNGKVLTPEQDTLYWVEFTQTLVSDDPLNENGTMHNFLRGGANCNWVQGWYDFTDDKNISIAFICSRAICGIATQFCLAGATTNKYSFEGEKLFLHFESEGNDPKIPNNGVLVFKPLNPND